MVSAVPRFDVHADISHAAHLERWFEDALVEFSA
jgi:hypothetical protein